MLPTEIMLNYDSVPPQLHKKEKDKKETFPSNFHVIFFSYFHQWDGCLFTTTHGISGGFPPDPVYFSNGSSPELEDTDGINVDMSADPPARFDAVPKPEPEPQAATQLCEPLKLPAK